MIKHSAFAFTALFASFLLSQTSQAADLGEADATPAVQEEPRRAFYIRGDVGYAFNELGGFSQAELIDKGGSFVSEDISNSPYIGGGVGVRLARWLRVDVTGEYRFSADVSATDYVQTTLYHPDGLMTGSTTYTGNYTSLVGLANVYIDLPFREGITPYVGAGVGFARNTFSDFSTVSYGSFLDYSNGQLQTQTSTGYTNDKSKTDWAWALMAGLSIDIGQNTKLDLGYRYVHLGSKVSATTDIISCMCGETGSPLIASDLESHEIRIGFRYEFDGSGASRTEPLK